MKQFEWLDSYIEERQKYIDIILANKKINGVCDITIEEIASKMNRSITTVKNKIKSINEDEEIIKQIGRNEFIIKKENFKESKTVIDLLTLLLSMSDFENYIKDEKTIEKETKISYKKIHFLKSRIPIELKNNTK